MNAETDTDQALITDQATAVKKLRVVRDGLSNAIERADKTMTALRETIVTVRPSGLLTVDEMAEAIEHDRNYVDSVWSNFGDITEGKQTRVSAPEDADEVDRATAKHNLSQAVKAQRSAASAVTTARAERDRTVAMVYASKLLGPTAIAAEVQVDRNHVLRIARRNGIAPQHRQGSRNQYSEGRVPKKSSARKQRKLNDMTAEVQAAERRSVTKYNDSI